MQGGGWEGPLTRRPVPSREVLPSTDRTCTQALPHAAPSLPHLGGPGPQTSPGHRSEPLWEPHLPESHPGPPSGLSTTPQQGGAPGGHPSPGPLGSLTWHVAGVVSRCGRQEGELPYSSGAP